jgi:hypothetical protein
VKFSINTYFDDQDGSFVAENYFINGEQVSEEEYDAVIEEFDGIEDFDDEVETCECEIECCADCEYNETGECDCPECTVEKYIEIIQDIIKNTGGCGGCIGNALRDFMFDIVDHIVIEDMDDNEYIN